MPIVRSSLLLLLSLALLLPIAQGQESSNGAPQSTSHVDPDGVQIRPDRLADDPARNLYWRQTRNGWQLIEMPAKVPAPAFRLARPVPRIHPFQVTMLISLAALAAIAWSSDEWDWGRLVEDEGADSRAKS